MGTSAKIITTACASLLLGAALPAAAADIFAATTLVSNQPGSGLQDASLVNAWGISYSPTGPFWVSDNGAGVSTIYNVTAATDATSKAALTVTIPGAGSVTGQVFNASASTGAFNGDNFLFVSEDGTVSGWRGALGTTAETLALPSDAIYKGAAIGSVSGFTYLYEANFHSGHIDVMGGSSATPALAGSFTDPNLPAGYAPFNVQNLGGELLVTYAQQTPGSADETAGPGLGIVDAFDLNGILLRRVATGGALNAPWGLAIAPASFGDLAGKLLVGNFGDGTINAYDLATGASAGPLMDETSNPLAIDGLWALTAGNGGNGGSASRIYFTAGPDDEANGALGVIAAVPLPAALPLLVSAFIGVIPSLRRRRPR